MTDVKWRIEAREIANCNCSYGCPCEYTLAGVGRGCSKTSGPPAYELADSYGHFCGLNLSESGVVANAQ